ncbi:hypothetical protein IV203_009787 [Nitzschia inconspicua]|uniref:Uncharacterized protein n=1 Tax=Nitzschia inconspicua TaxID=303405 RepID=A0A9K3PJV4_9STRA|nr:hypothetical protein IV203_009787 [Nitzschia inconspicua]
MSNINFLLVPIHPIHRRWFNHHSTYRRYYLSTKGSYSPSAQSTTTKSTAKTSSKRIQQQQQQQQQQRQEREDMAKEIPKWPAMASIFVVPILFAAWNISDYIFGNRQIGINEKLRQDFQQQHSVKDLDEMPAKLYCVVRKTHGFTHCLTGVRIGDIVEVLEEGVGPQNAYNLCRLHPPSSSNDDDKNDDVSTVRYGWFPYRWLETLDHYNAMATKYSQGER